MQTLYIDVYFLINFTVDLLALYFSASFSKIPTTTPRLMIASLVGALYAIFGILLLNNSIVMLPLSILFLIIMVFIVAKGVSTYRRIKYTVSFLIFEILIGGLVYYGYLTLDRYVKDASSFQIGGENRNLLILSLLVLLSIGVLKLIVSFFGNARSERCARILILDGKKETNVDALIDSGNLATDPFDKTPIMLIRADKGKEIFGIKQSALDFPDALDYNIKKKIRVIPVRFGENQKILYGFKPDGAFVITKKGRERISVVIALDEESTGYAGCHALLPLGAIEDIKI